MMRTNDPNVIEHRLLELAYTTDAKITAPVLAYYAMCSIENAERVLDDLVAKNRLQMEIEDDGTIVYLFPDRQKLEPRDRGPQVPRSLIAVQPSPMMTRREASPGLAAVLSLFIPGAGQLYAGRVVGALLWFLVVTAGYALLLPGLIMHLFCIVSAASSAQRLNASNTHLALNHGAL